MSSLAAQVARSTIYQTVGKIAAVVLGVGQYLLMVHFFGAAGSGVYAAVTAYLGIVVVLAELGLHIVTVTNISKPGADESKILSNAFTARTISALLTFTLATTLGFYLLPTGFETRLGIVLASLAFAFLSINQIFIGVFQKYLVNYMLVFGEIVAKTIIIIATIFLAKSGYGILAVLLSLNIAFGAHLILTMFFARRFVPFSLRFDFSLWRDLLRQSWPIAFSGILNLVYFKADTVILEAMKGPVAAGVYGLPYKILEVLLAFPVLFSGLLLPILSAAAAANMERFKSIVQHSFNALTYVVFLVIVEVTIFAKPLIRITTFDRFAEFQDSVPLLQLLIIAVAFLFIGGLFAGAVPALGLQKKMVAGYSLGALSGLVIYILLIPKLSYYGAAAGTIFTEAVVAFYAARLILKNTKQKLSFAGLGKAALAALVVGLISLVLLPLIPITSWWATLVTTTTIGLAIAFIYTILLYKLGGVSREDLRLLIPGNRKGA